MKKIYYMVLIFLSGTVMSVQAQDIYLGMSGAFTGVHPLVAGKYFEFIFLLTH
ncbi:hypothetical protein [Desulfovulcanus sp.]